MFSNECSYVLPFENAVDFARLTSEWLKMLKDDNFEDGDCIVNALRCARQLVGSCETLLSEWNENNDL